MSEDTLNLAVGATVQLQLTIPHSSPREVVRVIGYVPGGSLVVNMPSNNGSVKIVREGQIYKARMLLGDSVIGFEAKVLFVSLKPYPHMHLQYPKEFAQIIVRDSARVRTEIPCTFRDVRQPDTAENHHPATIVDLSETGAGASVRAADMVSGPRGWRFQLQLPTGEIQVQLQVPGRFMVANALAAATVGYCCEVPLEDIKAGLEAVEAVDGRMQLVPLSWGITLINDCYNANPASTAAAIATLTRMKGASRGALVLGDMLELGPEAAEWHRKTGYKAGQAGLDRLFLHGEFAGALRDGALEAGMPAERILAGEIDAISSVLTQWLTPGDWVLVKGSRGMRMERVIAALQKWAGQPKATAQG